MMLTNIEITPKMSDAVRNTGLVCIVSRRVSAREKTSEVVAKRPCSMRPELSAKGSPPFSACRISKKNSNAENITASACAICTGRSSPDARRMIRAASPNAAAGAP